jgi:predicted histone-like DNA-binding protein
MSKGLGILYVLRRLGNPGDKSAPKKYYLASKIRGHKRHKDVLEDAARNITSSPKEIDLAVSTWSEAIIRALSDGFSVEVADFGTFSTSIKSAGSDTEEDATAAKLESIQINFKPSTELRELINKINLEKFDPTKSL